MFSRLIRSMSLIASGTSYKKTLTVESLSKGIRDAQYAVRGEIVLRANELERQGRQIIYSNIGNPQQLNQKPITFFRQVLALIQYPDLLSNPQAQSLFPADALERAREYLRYIPGGSGAYSHSKGALFVRQQVASFISARDGGISSDPEDIYLTDGASPGIQRTLSLLIDKGVAGASSSPSGAAGILIPIPQYPLYSAAIAMLGGEQLRYELDESREWALDVSSMEQTVADAARRGIRPKAIVVINPGNPTGQTMTRANIEEVVRFAEKHHLVILADEVYQANVYRSDRPFVSFKKVVSDLRSPVELFSFHSTSKGMLGECGRRGGYFECVNVDEAVKEQIYKVASVGLCSNLDGQIMTGLMTRPPAVGQPSYELYRGEMQALYGSLARRAKKMSQLLNALDGMSCNSVDGAMYAFPQIRLSESAVAAAQAAGMVPDTFYCLRLLEETGICVVPGSGFGQKEGTWHFRTTILPPEEAIDAVVQNLAAFHRRFMATYP